MAWMVMARFWGARSDRVGRRKVLLIALAGFSVSYAVLGLFMSAALAWVPAVLVSFLGMTVARTMAGAFYAAVPPVCAALVADHTPPAERAKAMSTVGAASAVGMVAGPGAAGLLDGAGIAAALALGAAGVQLGTAFVSCPESAANAAYRAALAGPRAEHTRVSPVVSGRPARGIENAFMQRADEALTAGYPYAYDLGKALNVAASARGDDGYAPQWAGQATPLSRALPAAELVAALAQETRAAVSGLQALL
jgi:MFS family permease